MKKGKIKKKNENRDKYLDLARELKKTDEHEGNGDTCHSLCTWNGPERLEKRTGRNGIWQTNRDHSNYSIVEIGCNNKKSHGDLKRFVITQTPVKDHQQKQV